MTITIIFWIILPLKNDSFDTKLMIEDIKKLKNGETIQEPVYDYVVHNRSKDKTITLKPSKILIIEGILILQNKELRDLMDMKVFVDSVLTQYAATVKPMHEKYVEPSKKYADIIVLEGGHNQVAIDLFSGYISEYLRKNK